MQVSAEFLGLTGYSHSCFFISQMELARDGNCLAIMADPGGDFSCFSRTMGSWALGKEVALSLA